MRILNHWVVWKEKIAIIGLDGLSWDFLLTLINYGVLRS